MRVQSRHRYNDGLDTLDPYFTCPEAIESLIALEGDHLPHNLWEPAAGDGAIVHPLRATGRSVRASDIHDYGLAGCAVRDYLTADLPPGIEGIVTNPPYKRALQFAEKALGEVPYVAFLVRSNFDIEGVKRMSWRADHPPTRTWRSARRLPMMHRHGWTWPRAPSNTPYCWLIWERGTPRQFPEDFDWRELLGISLSATPSDLAATTLLRCSRTVFIGASGGGYEAIQRSSMRVRLNLRDAVPEALPPGPERQRRRPASLIPDARSRERVIRLRVPSTGSR
jgi:hypothetical protein